MENDSKNAAFSICRRVNNQHIVIIDDKERQTTIKVEVVTNEINCKEEIKEIEQC